ncbi:oxidoreductase [Dictyobacter sp. S3.2.2.5]|uniref:Oxidoreductase n=1 Tax=Dictyobacter halimunensis TaxID=3026934 RepID=A0ABQ6FT20_9CHLR|nr:oxidoreductase [Dictyobacter sp. S3.2.2.5]
MPLKIGVVGAGSMGMNHLRVLADFSAEQVCLVGVAETSEGALAYAMNRFHIAGYRDYRQMIDTTHPDLVAVVVPTNLHFEVASYLVEGGINVLIEKPMTSTIEEAEALLRLARRSGALVAVGHIERFNPAISVLKQHIMAGDIGTIFHLHARRVGPFPPRIRDVGVVLDLATHDIDIMRYLTGSEVAHVYAETQRHIHTICEDLLLGVIRFTNDVIGMLDINWLTPTKIRELTVTGEKGMFLVNYLTQDIYFYENDYTSTSWDALRSLTGVSEGTMTRLKVPKAEPLYLEYQDVIHAVQTKMSPTVTGEEGLATLKIVHQLLTTTSERAAARTREVIYASKHA